MLPRRQPEAAGGLRILALGERARRALERSGGIAAPLPGFEGAPYFAAGGQIVWIGPRVPAMHPRIVLTDAAPPRGARLRFAAIPATGWSARLPRLDSAVRASLAARAEALWKALLASASPRGFGALLGGMSSGFPLDLCMPSVDALRQAFERDDPGAALAPARSLLGAGAGLTPSGDDLVGGALFGRGLVAPRDGRWTSLAAQLRRDIRKRSHAISAALFAEISAGRSFAPLHDMADALAADNSVAALAAARKLAAIGHSSGWDMLAGFALGIGGG